MGTPHLPSVRTTVLTGIGMKSLLLLSLVCFAAGQDVPRKIRDQMAQWNFQERCWGYETMTQISLQLFKAQEYCNTLPPLHGPLHHDQAILPHILPVQTTKTSPQEERQP